MATFPSMMMRPRGGPALTLLASNNAEGYRSGGGGVTTNAVALTRTGGLAPFTFAWTRVSGSAFTADSPTASSTTFSISIGNGQSLSATFRCMVTSADGQIASIDVLVSATSSYEALSAYVSPTAITASEPYTGTGELQGVYTGYVGAYASGGTGNYTYEWELVSGAPIQAKPPNSWLTRFLAGIAISGLTHTAVFRCRVSDGANTVYTGNINVQIGTT